MPPNPSADNDDDHYASSEDSDFAPDDAPELGSEPSDLDDGVTESPTKRRRPDADVDGQDEGYDNSGDEAVISKGLKRQKRARHKAQGLDEEGGGEGGLVKTRRQRAEEKAERKLAAAKGPVTVDVDALWEQMVSGKPTLSSTGDAKLDEAREPVRQQGSSNGMIGGERGDLSSTLGHEAPDTIRIRRTYNFAGRVHTEERIVARDSAEAKLHLASQGKDGLTDGSPTKRVTKRAFRSAFEPVVDAGPGRTDLNLGVAARMKAAKEAQARKLNTVEKSRMDWAGYVDKEGIKDELELASKSKGSYNARQEFLARSEAVREDEARRARMATQA